MSSPSITEQLKQRLLNPHRDPETRLLRDFHDMPEVVRRSPSAQQEAVSRIVTEERFNQRIEEAVIRVESAGEALLRDIGRDASRWAERTHLSHLTSVMQKASKETPVNAEANRRAYRRVLLSSLLIFGVALLAIIGAMQIGWIPHPDLTTEEHRQLQWAKRIDEAGQKAAVEWAVEEIDSDEKLLEAQAAVAASDKGQSVRSEIRDLKACRHPGMQLAPSINKGPVCWFPIRPGL